MAVSSSTLQPNHFSFPPQLLKQSCKSPPHSKLGPYFQDGQRRVDYVLAYSIGKGSRTRLKSSSNFIRGLGQSMCHCFKRNQPDPRPPEDPEIAAQEQRLDYHEDDLSFRREEFEQKLINMGLQLEKDEGVSSHVTIIEVFRIVLR